MAYNLPPPSLAFSPLGSVGSMLGSEQIFMNVFSSVLKLVVLITKPGVGCKKIVFSPTERSYSIVSAS